MSVSDQSKSPTADFPARPRDDARAAVPGIHAAGRQPWRGRREETANALRRGVCPPRRSARLLDPRAEHSGFQISVRLRAARAVSQERNPDQRHVVAVLGKSSRSHGSGSLRRGRLSERRQTEEDHRRRYRCRHDDRPGHRPADRREFPAAFAAARSGRSGRQLHQLW